MSSNIVDVIIPVYRGLDETRSCIESVLAARQEIEYELIVIDDCSPDQALREWLSAFAPGKFTLLTNETNLGFVATVNRGMGLHKHRDVLLLNSDTLVANDWLDRIRACAYSIKNIATVTPFSNNATICSYPGFCADNVMPSGFDVARLDKIFAEANAGQHVEIPTGVGFCFYIKRAAIDDVGLFDVASFGRGYGEENDFCRRAIKSGWRNVLAGDVFVQHLGSVSFGEASNPSIQKAMETLNRMYPEYHQDVHRFINQDSIKSLRLRADLWRIVQSRLPVVLAISHNRGGGTQKHVDDLAALLQGQANHLLLRPIMQDHIEIVWNQPGERLRLTFDASTEYRLLLQFLNAIGVSKIHFQHLMGVMPRLFGLPADLGIPFDFTAHDYYSICPQISLTKSDNLYCGELGQDDCNVCLRKHPAPGSVGIADWRANYANLLRKADRVFAPSRDVAKRISKYFPEVNLVTAWHPEPVTSYRDPAPNHFEAERPIKVAVLGALSQIKGADVLEACAIDARSRKLPIEFVLVGYAYRHLKGGADAALTVTGEYNDASLPHLLEEVAPDVIWFCAQWPETYSYTLSATLNAGVPVIVPDLGAFRERVQGRAWSWLLPWNIPCVDINDFLCDIRVKNFIAAEPPDLIGATGETEPSFSYQSDYLIDLECKPKLDLEDLAGLVGELLQKCVLPVKRAPSISVEFLYYMRSLPFTSWLARRIPISSQRRVKNWLLGLK